MWVEVGERGVEITEYEELGDHRCVPFCPLVSLRFFFRLVKFLVTM